MSRDDSAEPVYNANGPGTRTSRLTRRPGDVSQLGLARSQQPKPGHLLRPMGLVCQVPAENVSESHKVLLDFVLASDAENKEEFLVADGLIIVVHDASPKRVDYAESADEVKANQKALRPQGRLGINDYLNPAAGKEEGSITSLVENINARKEYLHSRLDNLWDLHSEDQIVRSAGEIDDDGATIVEGVGTFSPPKLWNGVELKVYLRMLKLANSNEEKEVVESALLIYYHDALREAVSDFRIVQRGALDYAAAQQVANMVNPMEAKMSRTKGHCSTEVYRYKFVARVEEYPHLARDTGRNVTADFIRGVGFDREGNSASYPDIVAPDDENDDNIYPPSIYVRLQGGDDNSFEAHPNADDTEFEVCEENSPDQWWTALSNPSSADGMFVFEKVNPRTDLEEPLDEVSFYDGMSMLAYAAHAGNSAKSLSEKDKAYFSMARAEGWDSEVYFGSNEVLDQDVVFYVIASMVLFAIWEEFINDDRIYIILKLATSISRIRSGHTILSASLPRQVLKMMAATGCAGNFRESDIKGLLRVISYMGYHFIPFRTERLRVISMIQKGLLSFAIARRFFTYGPGEMPYYLLALYLEALNDGMFFRALNLQDKYNEFLSVFRNWSLTSWKEVAYAQYLFGDMKNEDTVARGIMDKMWSYAVSAMAAMPESTLVSSVAFKRDAKLKGGNSIHGPAAVEGFAQSIRAHFRSATTDAVKTLKL